MLTYSKKNMGRVTGLQNCGATQQTITETEIEMVRKENLEENGLDMRMVEALCKAR